MPGRRGFLLVKRAPKIMASSVAASLERAQRSGLLSGESVSHVVPHQANGLIISRLRQQLSQTEDPPPVVWDCIRNTGNTVSASIPLAMCQVQDKLPGGMLIGMPSVGAGGPGYRPHVLSTGCALVRKIGLHE
jgi:3-oxoacyl-[acyl-carrier-protein] synthase III